MIKIFTYLAFTLLSVVIQFMLMDLIDGNMQIGSKETDLNGTSQRTHGDIFKDYVKPHALYYKALDKKKSNNLDMTTVKYINTTLVETTTELMTTTNYEILLYDENSTDAELPFTTDLPETTEFENVTDISLFGTKNKTISKPTVEPKKKKQGYCFCDFMYAICDVNCCCDTDCNDEEIKLFKCTKETKKSKQDFSCSAQEKSLLFNSYDDLFCIAKTNLPDKRKKVNSYSTDEIGSIMENSFKWYNHSVVREPKVFASRKYTSGDPIWLLRNGSISYLDVPYAKLNTYCDNRTPIRFLENKSWKCDVTINDLEMFGVLKDFEETYVVTVNQKFMNNSVLNCTFLHCTNWTIQVCNDTSCTKYTKDLHEPTCTENVCTYLSHKIEYTFHYDKEMITNATIKLNLQKHNLKVPLIVQEFKVNFILAEASTDKIIKLSGNPGYVKGFPIIVSFVEGNHTNSFFNNKSDILNVFTYPQNKHGECVLTNITHKVVNFDFNVRSKCLYLIQGKITKNASLSCQLINNEIRALMRLVNDAKISPLGNPINLKDEQWLKFDVTESFEPVQGRYEENELICTNIATTMSLTFGYIDSSELEDEETLKIIKANAVILSANKSFSTVDPGIVLTFETMFVDITRKPVYEYASSPHLNIHLPKDFFFPFSSNISFKQHFNLYLLALCYVSTLI